MQIDYKLVDELVALPNRELLEILNETFDRRYWSRSLHFRATTNGRWFVVEHTGILDEKNNLRLLPESLCDAGLEPQYLALPTVVYYDEQDFLQSGGCDSCGVAVVCTHKETRCPRCLNVVYCT